MNRRELIRHFLNLSLLGTFGNIGSSYAKHLGKVVILGGGWGGLSVAKTIKRLNSSIDVTSPAADTAYTARNGYMSDATDISIHLNYSGFNVDSDLADDYFYDSLKMYVYNSTNDYHKLKSAKNNHKFTKYYMGQDFRTWSYNYFLKF